MKAAGATTQGSRPSTPQPYAVRDGLAVYSIGSGEPVLLMPGLHRFQQPGDGSAAPLIEGLKGLGRRVISFDPPGSGNSTRPTRLSMSEMHECADETLEVCGVSGVVDAVGHSMGGLVTLAYAIERPGRVKRLVLVGTGSGGPAYMNAPGALWNRGHPAFWRMALLGILRTLWPRLAPELMFNNFVRRRSFHNRNLFTPERVGPGDWLRPNKGCSDWHHKVARKLDYSPRLREIKVPALILCGRHDPQYPISASEELAAGIKNARLVYFERSGHYPFVEEPEASWAEVGRFLSTSCAGARGASLHLRDGR